MSAKQLVFFSMQETALQEQVQCKTQTKHTFGFELKLAKNCNS